MARLTIVASDDKASGLNNNKKESGNKVAQHRDSKPDIKPGNHFFKFLDHCNR